MVDTNIKEKFKKLYYDKFNIQLSNEEATKAFTDLINLMDILLTPDPLDEVTDPQNQQNEII